VFQSFSREIVTVGLFLAMSGVAGASREAVEAALGEYASSKNGHLRRTSVAADAPGTLLILDGEFDRLTVVYPGTFFEWDEASAHLSETLGVPVFSLHIHDEDLWMYVLYANGKEADWFNPIPDYWSNSLEGQERAQWAGNAEIVAKYWPGVSSFQIVAYLKEWDLDADHPGKAYSDDKYDFDCWQIADFMKRLGLAFPIDDQGHWSGQTYDFVAGE
jgi:hypothetical protein